jgi:hypothetical protein
MHIITKKRLGVKTEYRILTKEEADTEGMVYVHWKEGYPGMNVSTDDGFVVQCNRRVEYQTKTKPMLIVVTTIGNGIVHQYGHLRFLPRLENWNFSGLREVSWIEKYLKDKGFAPLWTFWALMRIRRKDRFDPIALGKLFFPDMKNSHIRILKMYKHPKVKVMINTKVQELMTELAMDERYTMTVIKDAINIAKTKKDSKGMLMATGQLIKLLDMEAQKVEPELTLPPDDEQTLDQIMSGTLAPDALLPEAPPAPFAHQLTDGSIQMEPISAAEEYIGRQTAILEGE